MMDSNKIISCGAIVYKISSGKILYLLLNHQKGGHWGFPKGRPLNNESFIEAAMREVQEETNLNGLVFCTDNPIYEEYNINIDGNNYNKKVIYFLAQAQDSNVSLSSEHNNFVWIDYFQLVKKLGKESQRVLIEEVKRILKNKHNLY
jgi:8-oxo-dGTP pyrophosphatase MutT (NUDIX family)